MTTNENDVLWYVFSISFKKELEVRDELLSLGFDSYVPMHYRLQTIHGRRVRRQEPSVYGLVFVKGARKALLEYRDSSRLKGYMFLKSRRMINGKLEYVIVREAEMENFRKLNEVQGAELTYYKPEELRLAKGEKVKIMDGPFAGITGIIQKLPHKRGQYLVVSLPNIAIATVSIKPEYIKPLTHKVQKSTDVEADSKLLIQQSLQIITDKSLTNKTVVLNEIKELRESLKDCKVFLANDKANYYFSFYASSLVTEQPTNDYKKLLLNTLPHLKANNLLRPTAHLLFYYETGEEKEYEAASQIIGKWDDKKYSDAQKSIIKLQRAVRTAKTKAGLAETEDDANNRKK